jgi:hypothetical protein
MRRSFKVALLFALGAAVVDVITACFVLDTFRHVTLPTSVRILVCAGFWPTILAQMGGPFFSRIDALFLNCLGWALIGFIIVSVWRRASDVT